MSPLLTSIIYVLVWRLSVLACGLVAVVLGYQLFAKGLTAPPGNIEVGVGNNSAKVSNVTPGVFYALFGAAIIVAIVWTAPAEVRMPKALQVEHGTIETSGGIIVRGE